ncbi:Hypothetical_protein [Hexamita inflata]|uniref:Hypothetical_protein n=1 Tax=Hexamita inflata TaxID=28002 RepID=A0ABP1HGL3_9EUKA
MTFEYILNKSTDYIRVESVLTKDQLTMIEHNESTVLLINQLNGTITDFSFLHKVVNVEMQEFINSQIIILVVSVVVIAIITITRDVILTCCKNHSKSKQIKQVNKIVNMDELE